VHYLITDFMATENKWIDSGKNTDPTAVEPSPRSWDRLSLALVKSNLIDDVTSQDFYSISCGYVGLEATIAFIAYAKNVDAQISGAEILNDFDSIKHKLDKLGPEKLNIAIDKLADYCLASKKKFNDKQGKNIEKFITLLPAELRLSCWSKLTVKGVEKIELAKWLHKHTVNLILEVFQNTKEGLEHIKTDESGSKEVIKADELKSAFKSA